MQIIHKVGQGPGEYLEPSDIDIESKPLLLSFSKYRNLL